MLNRAMEVMDVEILLATEQHTKLKQGVQHRIDVIDKLIEKYKIDINSNKSKVDILKLFEEWPEK